MAELGTAYVQIVPSAKGISSNLRKILDSEAVPEGDRAGKSIGSRIKSAIVKAGIAAAFGKVVKESITEGAKLEQSIGGIQTIFKSSANDMLKNAQSAFKRAGISANTYMEQATSFSASLLQATGGDTAKAAKIADMAILDMSDNANKMGTSIGDIQNAYQGFAKQNYTMLDNLKLGYGGTKTEMERLLHDAQKITGVKYDINNLSDVYNAIHVIQEELNLTDTSAKEAQSTISGSFNALKAAWQNLLGNMAIGQPIKESLNGVVEYFGYFSANILKAVGNLASQMPGVFGTLANTALKAGASIMNNLANSIKPDTLSNALKGLLPKITGFAKDIISNANSFVDAGAKLIDSIASGLSSNVTTLIDNILPLITKMSASLRQNASKLVDSGLNLILQLAQGFADGLPSFIENVPAIITNLAGIINDNVPKILACGIHIIITLAKGIIQSIPALIANIPQIFTAILAVWEALNWLDLGTKLITGIKNGVSNAFSSLKTSVSTLFNNIKSDISGIWGGIKSNLSEIVTGIKTSVINAFNSVKSGVSTIFNGIKSVASSVWNGIKSAIVSVANGVKSSVVSVFNSLKSSVSGAFNGIKGVASSVWNGIKSAITNPVMTAVSTVKSLVNKLKSAFNFSWSLPRLKLPHFSTRGKFSLNPPSVPTFSIKWYAQAMNEGMILNSPTIFGAHGNQLLGAGEVGSETVVGTHSLMDMIQNSVNNSNANSEQKLDLIYNALIQIIPLIGDMDVVLDGDILVGKTVARYNKALAKEQKRGNR